MRLVTFIRDEQQTLGLCFDDVVIDLDRAYAELKESQKIDAVLSELPTSMKQLIALEGAAGEAQKVWQYLLDGGKVSAEISYPFDSTELAPPIPDPGKIICLGGNYRGHCREASAELPKNPILFAKFRNALLAHRKSVINPLATNKLDYEAELVIVIGKYGKKIRPEDACDHIFGYTILNDISARDIQASDKQWIRAKSFDTFAPTGPYIVTCDEIPDPHNLAIKLILNGKVMQDSNTAEMIFKVPETVSFISEAFPLEPGDLIATGTPEGVGAFRNPPVFLKEGDRMEVVIEKIGSLHNTVIDEKPAAQDPKTPAGHQPPEADHRNLFS